MELIGENQNIVVKHYRDVDGVNNDIKKDLKGCYLTSFAKTSLDRTYRNILNMYFAQIERRFPKNTETDRIRDYVNNMLKEFCEVTRLD